MPSVITELKVTDTDREDARKGANFLARAASRVPAGLFLKKLGGEPSILELSSEIIAVLQAMLERLARAGNLLLLEQDAELSPEQAAKILGVSRPIVYHRMDSGRLPYRKVGAHRRVRLDDVLKLRELERQHREFARALSSDTDELESDYAQPPSPPLTDDLSEIETIFALRTRQRKDLAIKLAIKALRALDAKGIQARVVGSLARNSFSPHSDVDFAVDCDDSREYEAFRIIEKAMGSFPFHMIPCRRIEEDARPFVMEGAVDAPVLIARQAQI